MTSDTIVQTARSASTDIFGRTLNSARGHHYVIDGTNEPAEEVTPVEIFLSSISACAVQHVERYAREERVPVERVTAVIEAVRHRDDPSRFVSIALTVEIWGTDSATGERFVDTFRGHCPLFRTVASAMDIAVEVIAHPSP